MITSWGSEDWSEVRTPPLLSTAEEDDLVKFLRKSADIGYGRTRSKCCQ